MVTLLRKRFGFARPVPQEWLGETGNGPDEPGYEMDQSQLTFFIGA